MLLRNCNAGWGEPRPKAYMYVTYQMSFGVDLGIIGQVEKTVAV